jgi:putative acetyltransferase
VTSPEGTIRPEEPRDHRAVADLIADAFGRVEEAVLVEKLRSAHAEDYGPALVAEVEGVVVGYATLSVARIEGDTERRLLALGPVAVLPAVQGLGIGSALVERVLELADAPVVLLGDPRWYSRFGFRQAAPLGLVSQWEGVGDAWQVWFPREADPEVWRGEVRFAEPFGEVEPPVERG